MKIFEATEIWSSVEYGSGDLKNKEFVESEDAHAVKKELEQVKVKAGSLNELLQKILNEFDHIEALSGVQADDDLIVEINKFIKEKAR